MNIRVPYELIRPVINDIIEVFLWQECTGFIRINSGTWKIKAKKMKWFQLKALTIALELKMLSENTNSKRKGKDHFFKGWFDEFK